MSHYDFKGIVHPKINFFHNLLFNTFWSVCIQKDSYCMASGVLASCPFNGVCVWLSVLVVWGHKCVKWHGYYNVNMVYGDISCVPVNQMD